MKRGEACARDTQCETYQMEVGGYKDVLGNAQPTATITRNQTCVGGFCQYCTKDEDCNLDASGVVVPQWDGDEKQIWNKTCRDWICQDKLDVGGAATEARFCKSNTIWGGFCQYEEGSRKAVSYTHLTLPTKRIV